MKNAIKSCVKAIDTEESAGSADFCFPAEFRGFDGHFPGQPILPGICLIQSAMFVAGEIVGRPLQLREVVNAKFVAVVTPGMPLHVECSISGTRINASFTSSETRIASVKLEASDA